MSGEDIFMLIIAFGLAALIAYILTRPRTGDPE